MEPGHDSRTSVSLLLRLRDLENNDAWEDFLRRYGPKIFDWCRWYHLQDSDASDVTQEVLGKLIKAMKTFEYNESRGSFRAWLKTVTNNAIRDFLKSLSRPGRGTGDSQAQRDISAIQAPEALESLAQTIEAEAEQELLAEAEQRVRKRVKDKNWEAYRLTAIELEKPADVAETLDMDVANVYIAKSRVIKMLQEEVERLDRDSLSEFE